MAGRATKTATTNRPGKGRAKAAPNRREGDPKKRRSSRAKGLNAARSSLPGDAVEARRELIAIQKRVSKRLKAEIKASLGEVSPAVEIYYDEYDRELRGFERLATKAELLDRVVGADIVYHGDYHTLHQSQRALCRILEKVVARRPRIILGMEMVHIEDQSHLDRYMQGEIDDEAFLEAIDYENRWGFEWANYREILDLCKQKKIAVVGINSEPGGADRIIERDFSTAEVVVDATECEPDALVYVFDGDLHVARDHLPLIVDTLLQRRGIERKRLIIYQNGEPIYWQVAAAGLEHQANVVEVADDAFCIINATPIERLQSYLNWQQESDELDPVLPGWDDDGPAADYAEQVHGLVHTICKFLAIERDDLDDLSVYTTADLDFLRVLQRNRLFSAVDIAEIKRQILSSESYFIPRGNIIYLADLSVNHAAEEAAHFVHARCAGFADEPLPPFVDFYYRALREALGFFGSKIISHTRDTFHDEDFAEILEERPEGKLGPSARMFRSLARWVIQHRRFERNILRGKKPRRLKAIYHQKTDMHLGITHALGYMLGERLYQAMLVGLVGKAEIRDLFHQPFFDHADGTEGFSTYLELVARLRPLEDAIERKGDRL